MDMIPWIWDLSFRSMGANDNNNNNNNNNNNKFAGALIHSCSTEYIFWQFSQNTWKNSFDRFLFLVTVVGSSNETK